MKISKQHADFEAELIQCFIVLQKVELIKKSKGKFFEHQVVKEVVSSRNNNKKIDFYTYQQFLLYFEKCPKMTFSISSNFFCMKF